MRIVMKMLLCAALVVPAVVGAQTRVKKTDTVETASGKRTPVTADSSGDRMFIEKAASGGMAEVKLGKLALEKGTSPTVKEFAQKMVDDHSKANDELKKVAANKNMELPTEIDSDHKKTYDKLAKLSGADFDKAYMDEMVKDHDKDVAEFQTESKAAKDRDVRNLTNKLLPTLKNHQKMAHSGNMNKRM